jgi:hypothetical protein
MWLISCSSCSCSVTYHPVLFLLLLINLLLLFHSLFMFYCLPSTVLCGLPCCFSCYCFMLWYSLLFHNMWCIPWVCFLTTYNVCILSALLLAYNVLCCFIMLCCLSSGALLLTFLFFFQSAYCFVVVIVC